MKNRMSLLDCVRMTGEVKASCVGMYCHKVYSINSKTFLIKLNGGKQVLEDGTVIQYLLLESGVRFHCSKYMQDKEEVLSGFAIKLRKHIKGKRLENIRMLGMDRTIDFQFGTGENEFHIILEMYANGNIILTDQSLTILSLLRVFTMEESKTTTTPIGVWKVNETYPLSNIAGVDASKANIEHVTKFLSSIFDEKPLNIEDMIVMSDQQQSSLLQKRKEKEKKKKAKQTRSLKNCLVSKGSPIQAFGPELVEHTLVLVGLDPNLVLTNESLEAFVSDEQNRILLSRCFEELPKLWRHLSEMSQNGSEPAYIVMSNNNKDGAIYESFEAMEFLFQKHLVKRVYSSFSDAVDEYFAKTQEQRHTRELLQAEENEKKRVERVRETQVSRIISLQSSVQEKEKAAEIVSKYVVDVDNAIGVVNSMLASGMSWDDLAELVRNEQDAGNYIALLIDQLKLHENKMTIALPLKDDDNEEEDNEEDKVENDKNSQQGEEEQEDNKEEEEEEVADKQKKAKKKKQEKLRVDIDLSLSAHANIRELFVAKKEAARKSQKVEQVAEKVVAQAEKQVDAKLQSLSIKQTMQMIRKVYWFEKFIWFLTTEGILVLSGRDLSQTQILVNRFMRVTDNEFGDAFVHADVDGAFPCIVRNPKIGEAPIPLESLRQAGGLTISRSSAWTAKVITSAWWVSAKYVDKKTIRTNAKKEFLQPYRLEMGLGYIFKLEKPREVLQNDADVEWPLLGTSIPYIPPVMTTNTNPLPISNSPKSLSNNDVQEMNDLPLESEAIIKPELVTTTTIPKTFTSSAKKSKFEKKKAEKYANQTEEEMRIARALLGNPLPGDEGLVPRSSVKKEKEVKKLQKAIIEQKPDDKKSKTIPNQKTKSSNNNNNKNDPDLADATIESMEDDAIHNDEIVRTSEQSLRQFTGRPKDSDVLVHALVVCAPYSALLGYKYKVKLTPGALKKSRVISLGVHIVCKQQDSTEREVELMKMIPDHEYMASLIGNCKLVADNIEKVEASLNREEKKKNKKKINE